MYAENAQASLGKQCLEAQQVSKLEQAFQRLRTMMALHESKLISLTDRLSPALGDLQIKDARSAVCQQDEPESSSYLIREIDNARRHLELSISQINEIESRIVM